MCSFPSVFQKGTENGEEMKRDNEIVKNESQRVLIGRSLLARDWSVTFFALLAVIFSGPGRAVEFSHFLSADVIICAALNEGS